MSISHPELESETTFPDDPIKACLGDEQAVWMNKARTHKYSTGPVEDPMQGVALLAKEPKKG
jgi:hypothetical protein